MLWGGKGGVGKTSLASAFSVARAQAGQKTLLISTDPAHNLSDVFKKRFGAKAKQAIEHLDVIEIDPEKVKKEYIKKARMNMKQLTHAQFFGQIDEYVESVADTPGAQESALMEELSALIPEALKKYESVVLDTAPSGHTVRLLSLPGMMKNWLDLLIVKRGETLQKKSHWLKESAGSDAILETLLLRKEKFEKLKSIFLNKQETSFVFVMNPETVSFQETIRSVEMLEKFHIPVSDIFINKIWPEKIDPFFQKQLETQHHVLKEARKKFSKKRLTEVGYEPGHIVGVESLFMLSRVFS